MSIDSPHGGSSDISVSQDIWPNIQKSSLPHGVSQKHWDEAERIMQKASAEVAQTLGKDRKPIWNLDSRLSKIFQDAQLRQNNRHAQLEIKLWWKFEREIQELIKDISYISNPKSRVTSVALLSPLLDQKPTINVNKENQNIELWNIIFTRLSYIFEVIETIDDEFERKRLTDIYHEILGKLVI